MKQPLSLLVPAHTGEHLLERRARIAASHCTSIPVSSVAMPATELINAGVGKRWVIVQSLFKRSMGNLAVALQISNVHMSIVPQPRTARGLHTGASTAVEMHTGAGALMHSGIDAGGGSAASSLP